MSYEVFIIPEKHIYNENTIRHTDSLRSHGTYYGDNGSFYHLNDVESVGNLASVVHTAAFTT